MFDTPRVKSWRTIKLCAQSLCLLAPISPAAVPPATSFSFPLPLTPAIPFTPAPFPFSFPLLTKGAATRRLRHSRCLGGQTTRGGSFAHTRGFRRQATKPGGSFRKRCLAHWVLGLWHHLGHIVKLTTWLWELKRCTLVTNINLALPIPATLLSEFDKDV